MKKAAYGVSWIPKSLVESFLKTKWELLEYTGNKMTIDAVNKNNPEVVIAFLPPEELRSHKSVKYILTPGAGIDVLPLEQIKSSNQKIINCHSNSSTVAEHAWSLLLASSRKLIKFHTEVEKMEKWPSRSQIMEYNTDISRKTIGIVGFGAIGQKIVRFASAFDMRILVFRNHPDEGQYFQDELVEMADELDFLILACPLTDKTEKMINEELLEKLPSHVILVNIARGELIDEPALLTALVEGKIRGAALDVWSNSPYGYEEKGIPPSEFVGTPGLVISPHRAWVSKESYAAVAKALAHELDLISFGKTSENLIDLDLGY